MRSEKEKMIAGELYHAGDAELVADVMRAAAWMDRYNARIALDRDEQRALLREIMAESARMCLSGRRSTSTMGTTSPSATGCS